MANPDDKPKGWYSRGYLPHLDVPGLLQSVTFHLGDSLPKNAIEQLHTGTSPGDVERLRRMEQWLDAGYGACWLGRPEIARIVEDAFLHFDGQHYRLLRWVVMPNHVHLLLETSRDHRLPTVVQAWKSYTSKLANRALQRTGTFWARDYFDRYIRDDGHLRAVIHYIENNPVKAGLVDHPEDWPFGSASRRSNG